MDKENKKSDEKEMGEETRKGSEKETVGSVGDYLKMRREERGVSLKIVSKDTKISLTKLEFLEKNDFENLPNKIYIEGYIKSYAKSIGIVPDECLKILNLTYQKSSLRRRLSLQEIPKENGKRRVQSIYTKVSLAFLGIIFILLVVFFFGHKSSSKKYSDVKKIPPVQLKSVDTEVSFKMTPNKIVVGNISSNSSDKNTKISEKKADVEVSNPEKKKKLAEVEPDKKKIDFFPMRRSLYRVNTSVEAEDLARMIPDQIQRTIASGKQNVYIKASRGDSWLSYKADDKPVRNLTIKKDHDLLIKGEEVRVFFANIKALDIFLNNKLLSIDSTTGLKSVVFPQENRAKYVRPLFIYHDSGKVETSDEYLARTQENKEESESL